MLQAGAGTWLPSQQATWVPMIIPEGTLASSGTGRFPATAVVVTPGYFDSLGIARIHGRTFTASDEPAGSPGVVIVNRTFVDLHWPEGDPIGRRLKYWWGPATSRTGSRSSVSWQTSWAGGATRRSRPTTLSHRFPNGH